LPGVIIDCAVFLPHKWSGQRPECRTASKGRFYQRYLSGRCLLLRYINTPIGVARPNYCPKIFGPQKI